MSHDQKIVNKSKHWSKHGRHKIGLRRENAQEPKLDRTTWYGSVQEAFASRRRKR